MKKVLSAVLAALGAALLVLGIALPTYVIPKGKVLPLDLVSTTGTAPTPGNLLDSKALAAGIPVDGNESRPECSGDVKQVSCFMWHGLDIQSQRFTVAQEPSDDKQVTLELGQTVFRTDLPEPNNLISATVDRITLDRKTQMPVADPVSSVLMTPPITGADGARKTASVAPFTRNGIQYQWPMGTDKKSYPYFDLTSMTTNDIDFVAEEDFDGVTVYRFEQTIDPIEIYPLKAEALESDGELDAADKAVLAPYRLAFPANVWGIEATEADMQKAREKQAMEAREAHEAAVKAAEEAGLPAPEAPAELPELDPATVPVELTRFYTVERTIWVEPRTGVIVNGQENIWKFYARDLEEANTIATEGREAELANPTRTALYYPGAWNEESRANQMAKAREGFEKMEKLGKTVPMIIAPVGIVLLAAGLFLARKRG